MNNWIDLAKFINCSFDFVGWLTIWTYGRILKPLREKRKIDNFIYLGYFIAQHVICWACHEWLWLDMHIISKAVISNLTLIQDSTKNKTNTSRSFTQNRKTTLEINRKLPNFNNAHNLSFLSFKCHDIWKIIYQKFYELLQATAKKKIVSSVSHNAIKDVIT
jgi:ABC-type protease/lipase transport system fused ATPase/permease subunit